MRMRSEVVIKRHSTLGEGAIWDAAEGVLYWVDIVEKILFTYDPMSGTNRELKLEKFIGTVVPRGKGGLTVALEDGFYNLDPATGVLEQIADPESGIPGNRFNDGKCDPSGRFWAGTMGREGEAGKGSLYRLDADGNVTTMLSGIHISNGICWSPDKRTMYHTDTLDWVIRAYDYDDKSGTISGERTVVTVAEKNGFPDGMTIDAEGMLWVALWEGGRVIRYDPDTGRKLAEVSVPVSRVTSCAFGGPGLGTLYITTATMGMDESEMADEPLAGSLFACEPGVVGMQAFAYEG